MSSYDCAAGLLTRRSLRICLHGGPVVPYIRKDVPTRPQGGDPR